MVDSLGMSKPFIHAKSSSRRFGGKPDDYLDIHNWFDRSKAWFPDNRHRVFTHHSEGIFECERVFGVTRVNSDGRTYSVRDIGEQHISEDFSGKFIPCVADYINNMSMEAWMNNGKGGTPPSYKKVDEFLKSRTPVTTSHIPFEPEVPVQPTTFPNEAGDQVKVTKTLEERYADILKQGIARTQTSLDEMAGIPEVVIDGGNAGYQEFLKKRAGSTNGEYMD